MKCPNCKKENEPDARFCIGCGTKLERYINEEPLRKMRERKEINPNLYTLPAWGGSIALIIGAMGPRFPLWWQRTSFMGLGLIEAVLLIGIAAIMYAEIYFLISLYRCWSVLQGSTARTTPGKAVGFLFIPFFGIYWIFVAIRGLAKDANMFLSQKNKNENKISVGLSLITCIIAIIPYVNYLTFIPQSILIYQWSKFCNYQY